MVSILFPFKSKPEYLILFGLFTLPRNPGTDKHPSQSVLVFLVKIFIFIQILSIIWIGRIA